MPAKRKAASKASPSPASDSSLSDVTPPTDVEADPAVTNGDEEAYDDAAPAKEEPEPAAVRRSSSVRTSVACL